MSTLDTLSPDDNDYWSHLNAQNIQKRRAERLGLASPSEKRKLLVETYKVHEKSPFELDRAILLITHDDLERAYLEKKKQGSGLTMLPQNMSKEQLKELQKPTGLSEAANAAFAELISQRRRAELNHLFSYVQSAQEVGGSVQRVESGEAFTVGRQTPIDLEKVVENARASLKQMFPQ